jgi:hypothetical protein
MIREECLILAFDLHDDDGFRTRRTSIRCRSTDIQVVPAASQTIHTFAGRSDTWHAARHLADTMDAHHIDMFDVEKNNSGLHCAAGI